MAEVSTTLTNLEPGVMLDRYEVLCAIARGGMANVWLGRLRGKHGFERHVAIKTILPEYALDTNFQTMFLEEARIASGIDHPNVAKTLDLGEHHDALYLVMEYVDGDSLARVRKQLERMGVPMPLPLLLRILSDVCAGLHAAHELLGSDGVQLGVVHRDVSPPNVLIATNGAVKVIDFGVAKARDRLAEETGAGLAKGKARYMAPEQAMGRAIDRRADVYSVGAIAYEMFEHVGPYDGANDMARIHALITGGAITKMASSPPPAVQAFILRALSRDPGSRFQTCADLRDAIEAAMTAARLRATSEDVAKFLAEKTGSRIEERHSLVKMALDAAGERERFRKLLDGVPAYHAREQSSSGIKNAPAFSPEESNLETLSASALSVISNSISTAAALPVRNASDSAVEPARDASDSAVKPEPLLADLPGRIAEARDASDSAVEPARDAPDSAVEPEGDAAPEVDERASERRPASDFSRESGAPPPARRRAGLYAIGGFAALALVIGAAAFAQRTRHAAAPAQAPALTSAPVPLSVGTATVATSLTPPSLPALAPPVASVQPSAAVAVDASAPRRPTVAAGASSATSLRATSTAKPPASAVRPPIRPKHDDNEIQ
jgi:hypothetical protein